MSRNLRRVELDPPGSVVTIGPKKAAPRALDFVTWRAYLAAPGSRFDAAPSASQQIVRLMTGSQAAVSSEAERRTA
jgi:hypothetical protein